MKKTIEQIRKKPYQKKKMLAMSISIVITGLIAGIVFLSFLQDLNTQGKSVSGQDPISVRRNTLISEIKNSLVESKR